MTITVCGRQGHEGAERRPDPENLRNPSRRQKSLRGLARPDTNTYLSVALCTGKQELSAGDAGSEGYRRSAELLVTHLVFVFGFG